MTFTETTGKKLNDAMAALGAEGFLAAGFVLREGELVAIFDNVPGSMRAESMRKLLWQVREALREGSGVKVEQENLVDGHKPKTESKEMN